MSEIKKESKSLLLTVDIGNTTIHLGIFKDKRLLADWRLFSQVQKTQDEYRLLLKELFDGEGIDIKDIEDTIICSVVPRLCDTLVGSIWHLLKIRPLIVGEDVVVPIKNLYRNPKQVGSDRLVCAFAASKIYGAPLIVVDFGTAITFDVVSKDKEYLGGMIVPGIEVSLEALTSKAALLPKIELKKPKELLGRDTISSMTSGIIYGFSSLTDGLIERLKGEFRQELNSTRSLRTRNARSQATVKVIATGGLASLIFPYCKTIDKVDLKLILKGLQIIYAQRQKCLKTT